MISGGVEFEAKVNTRSIGAVYALRNYITLILLLRHLTQRTSSAKFNSFFACMHACMHTYTHIYIYVYIYIYIYIYIIGIDVFDKKCHTKGRM